MNKVTEELSRDARDLLQDEKTMNKVASVTAAFWIMKICATTVGETAGDMFSMTFDIGYALSSLLLLSFFVVTLVIQLRAKSFHPTIYWLVVLSTSTAGTTMSDFMDRTLALGYAAGTSLLVSILIGVLVVWRLVTGSLSVSHIADRRSEVFYWFAILASNTLGTALGDFLAKSHEKGGLAFGTIGSSAVLLGILAVFIFLSNRQHSRAMAAA